MKTAKNEYRVLQALTNTALNRDTFATLADLADAVKFAAARCRIPYSTPTVAAALRSVGSRRPLISRREG
jgi:hypothetical protein